MVEQRSPKPTVEGSSPSAPASKPPFRWFLCFWALMAAAQAEPSEAITPLG